MKSINQYVFRVNYLVEDWIENVVFTDHEQLIVYNSNFPSQVSLKELAYQKCFESWPDANHIHVISVILVKITETSVKVKA